MSRRDLWIWILVCGLLVAAPLTAQDDEESEKEAPPPTIGLHVGENAQMQLFDAVLPGPLLSVAFPVDEAGRTSILALVAPEGDLERPRGLYRFDAASGTLSAVTLKVPAEVTSLALADLEGDGRAELLLGGPEVLYSLPASGTPPADAFQEPLLTGAVASLDRQPGFDLHTVEPATGRLHLADVGLLTAYRRVGATLERTERYALPVRAEREPRGLRLTTAEVTAIHRGSGRPPLYAVGPEAHGKRRLRTVLIDPELPGEEGWTEAWSQLPGNERVRSSWYTAIDGKPALIVTTFNADKLGLLAKARLRLFPLRADRTRAGREPTLETRTTSRRWQDPEPVLRDVDDDGRLDLVMVQPEGLASGHLVVDAFLGIGDGRFRSKPVRTQMEVDAQGWSYGEDVDGDGRGDLVVQESNAVRVYPGRVVRRGQGAVAKQPSERLALAEGEGNRVVTLNLSAGGADARGANTSSLGRLRVLDLDADGHGEILATVRSDRGRGRIRVIRLR